MTWIKYQRQSVFFNPKLGSNFLWERICLVFVRETKIVHSCRSLVTIFYLQSYPTIFKFPQKKQRRYVPIKNCQGSPPNHPANPHKQNHSNHNKITNLGQEVIIQTNITSTFSDSSYLFSLMGIYDDRMIYAIIKNREVLVT
jgi:hypothetical protein